MLDDSVDLWAFDEVHFQQHGSRCVMWVLPEVKDPTLPHHPTRKNVGYFGAVRLRDGKFVFRQEQGKFEAETCLVLLKQLSQASKASGKRVVLVADNASYHHSRFYKEWRKQRAPFFALDFLPPYSPGLNPVERVWKLTRRLCTHNRYFSTLDEVILAVENQFSAWEKGNDTLNRFCAII